MNPRFTQAFVFAIVATMGISFTLTGLALLFAPQFFFDNIGTFPPFNRHYMGDLGTYSLPLGLALLWAARNPMQHRLLILAAVGINLMHAGNHAYDDLLLGTLPSIQTVILMMSGVLLAGALLFVKAETKVAGQRVAA